MTQRGSQRGSGDSFRQLIDTKNRSDLIHIYNSLLSPRQKAVSLFLFTFTPTFRAAFSFQRHSPVAEYFADGVAVGLGGAWAKAKAGLAFIVLPRDRLYLDGSSSMCLWG